MLRNTYYILSTIEVFTVIIIIAKNNGQNQATVEWVVLKWSVPCFHRCINTRAELVVGFLFEFSVLVR